MNNFKFKLIFYVAMTKCNKIAEHLFQDNNCARCTVPTILGSISIGDLVEVLYGEVTNQEADNLERRRYAGYVVVIDTSSMHLSPIHPATKGGSIYVDRDMVRVMVSDIKQYRRIPCKSGE